MSSWIMGALSALFGLMGLFVAARTHEAATFLFGMLLAAFAVAFCWWLIKSAFDRAEGKPQLFER